MQSRMDWQKQHFPLKQQPSKLAPNVAISNNVIMINVKIGSIMLAALAAVLAITALLSSESSDWFLIPISSAKVTTWIHEAKADAQVRAWRKNKEKPTTLQITVC
jgi:hypothetical protein